MKLVSYHDTRGIARVGAVTGPLIHDVVLNDEPWSGDVRGLIDACGGDAGRLSAPRGAGPARRCPPGRARSHRLKNHRRAG